MTEKKKQYVIACRGCGSDEISMVRTQQSRYEISIWDPTGSTFSATMEPMILPEEIYDREEIRRDYFECNHCGRKHYKEKSIIRTRWV